MRFAVEVSGDREAERTLREVAARGRSTKPAFVRMLRDLEDEEVKWFEGRGEGTWPGMDPDTVRRHGEHELLELTGTLMKSLTRAQGFYAVREASDAEATFGTRDPV